MRAFLNQIAERILKQILRQSTQLRERLATSKQRKKILMILPITVVLIFYQNCSKGFSTKTELPSVGNTSQSIVVAPTPTPAPSPGSCLFDGTPIKSGDSVTVFFTSTVPNGQTCASEVRKCTNGILSGTAEFSICTPGAPAACLFDGGSSGVITVPDSKQISAWQTSSVKYGQNCVSETRTCSNGSLSGSFKFGACHEPVLQKISAGPNYSCALIDDSERCWGRLGGSQIMDGGPGSVDVPLSAPRIAYSSFVTDISSRTSTRWECHIIKDAINCSGIAEDSSNVFQSFSVTLVSSGASKVWVGDYHACGMVNSVFNCWLLPTLTTGLGSPSQPLLGQDVIDMDITAGAPCAITTGGAVTCWQFQFSSATPLNIKNVIASGAQKILTNMGGAPCALVGNDLKCWSRSGDGIAMPDGTSLSTSTPQVVMSGVTDFAMASMGSTRYLCAVKTDTSLVCWGSEQTNPLVAAKTIVPVGVSGVSLAMNWFVVIRMIDGRVMTSDLSLTSGAMPTLNSVNLSL